MRPGARRSASADACRSAKDRGEMERAALTLDALDPDAAAHQLDQPARDRQTEARAAKAAGRRGVGLGEGLEDGLLLVARNADARVA